MRLAQYQPPWPLAALLSPEIGFGSLARHIPPSRWHGNSGLLPTPRVPLENYLLRYPRLRQNYEHELHKLHRAEKIAEEKIVVEVDVRGEISARGRDLPQEGPQEQNIINPQQPSSKKSTTQHVVGGEDSSRSPPLFSNALHGPRIAEEVLPLHEAGMHVCHDDAGGYITALRGRLDVPSMWRDCLSFARLSVSRKLQITSYARDVKLLKMRVQPYLEPDPVFVAKDRKLCGDSVLEDTSLTKLYYVSFQAKTHASYRILTTTGSSGGGHGNGVDERQHQHDPEGRVLVSPGGSSLNQNQKAGPPPTVPGAVAAEEASSSTREKHSPNLQSATASRTSSTPRKDGTAALKLTQQGGSPGPQQTVANPRSPDSRKVNQLDDDALYASDVDAERIRCHIFETIQWTEKLRPVNGAGGVKKTPRKRSSGAWTPKMIRIANSSPPLKYKVAHAHPKDQVVLFANNSPVFASPRGIHPLFDFEGGPLFANRERGWIGWGWDTLGGGLLFAIRKWGWVPRTRT